MNPTCLPSAVVVGAVLFFVLLLMPHDGRRNCDLQGKWGHYAHARAHGHGHGHRHGRTLPNPEVLGPEIEEGAVNRRSLQALFLLPRGGARPATGPGAI